MLLRLVSVANLILILSHPFIIQGREPCLCDFVKINFNIGLYSDKRGMMIWTTKLYIVISVWMTLAFIQGHNCMRNQKALVSIFSETLQWIGMKFSMLPQPVGLLKLMLNSFCTKGKNSADVI